MARGSYTIHSVDEVIAALGGVAVVCALIGRSPQALSNWRAAGRIASDLFFQMTSELERLGYSADPAIWGQQTPTEEQAA